MILGVTGHRPHVWNYDADASKALQTLIHSTLRGLSPTEVITGMALGFDQEVALACFQLKIPFTAAVPFEGQEARWNNQSKIVYNALLKAAKEVVIVSKGPYDPELMLRRNEWIIKQSEFILTLWDGRKEGGTAHAVQLAEDYERGVVNLWEQFRSLANL